MSSTFRISSRTTAVGVLRMPPARASAIRRVEAAAPNVRVAAGVLQASVERLSELRELSLPMATYDAQELDAALAVGCPGMTAFAGGCTPATGHTLVSLARKPGLVALGAQLGAVSFDDGLHLSAWRHLEGRALELMFLIGCEVMPASSLAELGRRVSARFMILAAPAQLRRTHVVAMLRRCARVEILGESPLLSAADQLALLQQARPGQLAFLNRGANSEV